MSRTRTERKPGRVERSIVFVRVDHELKRWLAHRSVDEGRPESEIVRAALEAYRARVARGAKS